MVPSSSLVLLLQLLIKIILNVGLTFLFLPELDGITAKSYSLSII